MLTVLTLVLGFAAGITTLVVVDHMLAKRDTKLAVEQARAKGYDLGYSDGAKAAYAEAYEDGIRWCAGSHHRLEQVAADKARAENERRWEVDLLPGMLTFARAEVRAELLQEKQEAQAKLVSEVEDTYW